MKLQDQLRVINGTEYKPDPFDLPGLRTKGLILTDTNDAESLYSARKLALTIHKSRSLIDYVFFPATTPTTVERDLPSVSSLKDPLDIPWSWPTDEGIDHLDVSTGLLKRYVKKETDYRKLIANTVSHIRAWQMVIDLNQPLVILEPRARFNRRFAWDRIEGDINIRRKEDERNNIKVSNQSFNNGVLALNTSNVFVPKSGDISSEIQSLNRRGLFNVPLIGRNGDPNRAQAFPGKSAYVITPWGAKKGMDLIEQVGMWPIEYILCRQLAPWAQLAWPEYVDIEWDGKDI